MTYLVSTLHPGHCFHPSYASWAYLWDLRRDPEPLLNTKDASISNIINSYNHNISLIE